MLTKQLKKAIPHHLTEVLQEIYLSARLNIYDFERETESQEYGACQFRLENQKIVFRLAKTTPKKAGQFVVLWKRSPNGIIKPYDFRDEVDFFIVAVRTPQYLGQFVFPKNVLYKKGVLSGNGLQGKRAIRVCPSWDTTTSRTARHTQGWQLEYFFEIDVTQAGGLAELQKNMLAAISPKGKP